MQTALLIINLISIIGMVTFILLQQSKGAEMGASFSGGGSDTVFGAVGSMSIFARITTVLALVFFVSSLSLAYLARQQGNLGISSDYDLGIETTELGDEIIAPTATDNSDSGLGSFPEAPTLETESTEEETTSPFDN